MMCGVLFGLGDLFVYCRTIVGQSVGIGLPTGNVGSAIGCRWWAIWGRFCGVGYAISLGFGARIRIVDCATVCLLDYLLILVGRSEKCQNLWHLVYSKWGQNDNFFKKDRKSFLSEKKSK